MKSWEVIVFYILIFVFTCYYVSLNLLQMLIRLFSKKKLCGVKNRDEEPACLRDPSIGEHGYLELKKRDGIKIHYVANGSRTKPLMVFLHGFPEFWYMWKNELREFGKFYYAVAIDMPGYGHSSVSTDFSKYAKAAIAADIKEFVLELGYTSCVLVGHDWGGGIAYTVAIEYPNVVDKLIIMNCPHAKAARDAMSISQLWKSSYMFYFQVPYFPEYFMSYSDYNFLYIFKKYSKSDNFNDETIDAYKYAFHKSGFTGPLNYYRNALQVPSKVGIGNVVMPSVLIWGTNDFALGVELAAATEKYLDKGKVVYIDGASHFVNADAPELVHQHMREFLGDD